MSDNKFFIFDGKVYERDNGRDRKVETLRIDNEADPVRDVVKKKKPKKKVQNVSSGKGMNVLSSSISLSLGHPPVDRWVYILQHGTLHRTFILPGDLGIPFGQYFPIPINSPVPYLLEDEIANKYGLMLEVIK